MPLAEHLVGRAEELGSFDRLLAHLDGGRRQRSSSSGSLGSARPACSPSSRAARMRANTSVLSGCATELEHDLPFWMFVDALDEYVHGLDPARLDELEPTSEQSCRPSFHRWRRSPTEAGPHPSTSATAATARCASCWSSAQGRGRSCLCSTTSTGPMRHRSSCWVRCSIGRPPRRCCLRWRCGPGSCQTGWRLALERAHRPARSSEQSSETLTRAEARELVGPRQTQPKESALYEESGGNPFYLEQLARSIDRAEQFAARRS